MPQRHYPIPGKTYSRILFAAFLLLAGVCKGQPVVTAAVTNPTCAYNNGSFVATATGGTPPYSYFSNAARESNSTGIFGELAAGTYDLTVRDNKGIQTTTSVVLTNPGTFPYFTSAVVNAMGCNTNDGQVTLTPAGGTPPYQYSINAGANFSVRECLQQPGTGILQHFDRGRQRLHYGALVGDRRILCEFPIMVPCQVCQYQRCQLSAGDQRNAFGTGLRQRGILSASANTTGGTTPYFYSIDGGVLVR
jgi:hypothetical protein